MLLPASLAALAPASARFCLRLEKSFLKRFKNPAGLVFLAAFSGGADSTALVCAFNILARRNGFRLEAMHIDHSLRPESATDADFARKLCAALEIPLACVKMDVGAIAAKKRIGLEEAGRECRRAALLRQAMLAGAEKILLGHHAGDLAEDIAMRLIRGCGWPGLGGMKREQGPFFRPFLHINPREPRDFLIAENIPWREDQTNASPVFLRNRVRHQILPALLRENPSFYRAASGLGALAALDRDYWDTMLDEALAAAPWLEDSDKPEIFINGAWLRRLHPALRLRIYLRALSRLRENLPAGVKAQARMETLLKLDDACAAKHSGRIFQLPGGISATTAPGGILFSASAKRTA